MLSVDVSTKRNTGRAETFILMSWFWEIAQWSVLEKMSHRQFSTPVTITGLSTVDTKSYTVLLQKK
jgi:hypothetical protein